MWGMIVWSFSHNKDNNYKADIAHEQCTIWNKRSRNSPNLSSSRNTPVDTPSLSWNVVSCKLWWSAHAVPRVVSCVQWLLYALLLPKLAWQVLHLKPNHCRPFVFVAFCADWFGHSNEIPKTWRDWLQIASNDIQLELQSLHREKIDLQKISFKNKYAQTYCIQTAYHDRQISFQFSFA